MRKTTSMRKTSSFAKVLHQNKEMNSGRIGNILTRPRTTPFLSIAKYLLVAMFLIRTTPTHIFCNSNHTKKSRTGFIKIRTIPIITRKLIVHVNKTPSLHSLR